MLRYIETTHSEGIVLDNESTIVVQNLTKAFGDFVAVNNGESSTVESGMKRYVLTDKGKEFFEEQVKFGQKYLGKLEWLEPMLVGGFHFGTNHENLLYARESAKRVLETFIEFKAIKDSLTTHDVEEIVNILDYSDKQLKKIAQRIKEKKPA